MDIQYIHKWKPNVYCTVLWQRYIQHGLVGGTIWYNSDTLPILSSLLFLSVSLSIFSVHYLVSVFWTQPAFSSLDPCGIFLSLLSLSCLLSLSSILLYLDLDVFLLFSPYCHAASLLSFTPKGCGVVVLPGLTSICLVFPSASISSVFLYLHLLSFPSMSSLC